jgi:hypothetical protein
LVVVTNGNEPLDAGHEVRQSLEIHSVVAAATVEKKFVEVALVVVAFTPVKFWKVEEAVARRLPV